MSCVFKVEWHNPELSRRVLKKISAKSGDLVQRFFIEVNPADWNLISAQMEGQHKFLSLVEKPLILSPMIHVGERLGMR